MLIVQLAHSSHHSCMLFIQNIQYKNGMELSSIDELKNQFEASLYF